LSLITKVVKIYTQISIKFTQSGNYNRVLLGYSLIKRQQWSHKMRFSEFKETN